MTTNDGSLVIRFLNVGQGDSTHLILPTGEHMLIDINLDRKCGGIDVIQYLADELPAAGNGKQKRLDYLVVTHPHDDHIRGLGQVGNQFEIGEMWHSGHELDCEKGENESYDKYQALIENLGDAAKKVCAKSEAWATVGDVTFHVYRPSAYVKTKKDQTEDEKRNVIHNECMVLKVTFGSVSVIFTGDTHKGAWESIVKHYEKDGQLEATVLHASHHGSRTFYKDSCEDDEPWTAHLDAIDPEEVIVSVGAGNQHKHPHSDMMKEYRRRVRDESIFRTDEDLTIELRIDAKGNRSWQLNDEDFQEKYQLPAEPDDKNDGDDRGKGDGGGKESAAKAWSPAIPVSRTRLPEESISA